MFLRTPLALAAVWTLCAAPAHASVQLSSGSGRLTFSEPPVVVSAEPGSGQAALQVVVDTGDVSAPPPAPTPTPTPAPAPVLIDDILVDLRQGGTIVLSNPGGIDLTGSGDIQFSQPIPTVSGSVITITPPVMPVVPVLPLNWGASVQCGGAFTLNLGASTTLSCEGPLSISGGFVSVPDALTVKALGDISLDQAFISATQISFSTPGHFSLGETSVLRGFNVGIDAQQMSLLGSISFAGATLPTPPSAGGSIVIIPRTDERIGGVIAVGGAVNSGSSLSLVSGGDISLTGAIPEPGTWALMALGLAGVGLVAHRRSHG